VGWPRQFNCRQDDLTAIKQKQNIIQVREHYLSLLQPSEPTYILGKIEILESRYYQRDTNPTVQDEIDKEWIEDLSEYPPDLIELACSVKQEYVRRVVMYRKAVSVLEIINANQ
jgi:hypothetical protein